MYISSVNVGKKIRRRIEMKYYKISRQSIDCYLSFQYINLYVHKHVLCTSINSAKYSSISNDCKKKNIIWCIFLNNFITDRNVHGTNETTFCVCNIP